MGAVESGKEVEIGASGGTVGRGEGVTTGSCPATVAGEVGVPVGLAGRGAQEARLAARIHKTADVRKVLLKVDTLAPLLLGGRTTVKSTSLRKVLCA